MNFHVKYIYSIPADLRDEKKHENRSKDRGLVQASYLVVRTIVALVSEQRDGAYSAPPKSFHWPSGDELTHQYST